ncbi:MAG: PAS domain S-box protein [Acidobacteria bacterium]|nr:MAG: PAS domain S-box protein [Acidobacteriota bacterium]REK05926.1 MAG: PAS domain S-box protein [Acidobacteriota bacterium]
MTLATQLLSVLTAGGLSALFAYVLVRRPPAPYWPQIPLILTAGLLYLLGDLITRDPIGRTAEFLGITLLYAGIHLACWAWLVLALRLGSVGLRPAAIETTIHTTGALAAVIVMLVATNPLHGWVLEPVLGERNVYRPLWWVHAGFAAAEMTTAVVVLLAAARATDRDSQRRSCLLLAAIGTAVAAGSLTYALAPVPLPFDPVVPLSLLGSIAFVLGIYRLQIFNLLPDTLPEIVDRTLDAIVLGDGGGRIVYANRAAHQLLDLDLESSPVLFDLLTQHLEDETGELSEDLVREALERAVGADSTMTVRTRREPRRTLAIRLHELPWGRSNLAMAAELQDITERHEQRQRLRLSERRLRRLIHTAPVGILACDGDGTIETVNSSLVQTLGATSSQELVGQSVLRGNIVRAEEVRSLFRRCLERGESTFGYEWNHTSSWGRATVTRISVEPLRDSDERIVGALAMVEDITEAKQLEREQRQLERRMFDAQRLQSLGMVAGAIAHDFNNLLTIMKGHVELGLLKVDDDEPVKLHLDQIAQSTRHGSELTDQIMAYAGQAPASMHAIDCSTIAAEMETLLEAVIGKRVPFEQSLTADLPKVLGDSGQLRQILVNLLLNAAHAQKGRPGSVRLSTLLVEFDPHNVRGLVVGFELPRGRYVCVEVADDGVGMDARTRERVFDPFFTTREDGRGLGLAATLGIVRAHGAALSLESEEGVGTTFRLYFPGIHEPVEEEVDAQRDSGPAGRTRATQKTDDGRDSAGARDEEKEGAAPGSAAP